MGLGSKFLGVLILAAAPTLAIAMPAFNEATPAAEGSAASTNMADNGLLIPSIPVDPRHDDGGKDALLKRDGYGFPDVCVLNSQLPQCLRFQPPGK